MAVPVIKPPAIPPEQVDPVCEYPFDKNFPIICKVDYSQAYCCKREEDSTLNNFVFCDAGDCIAGRPPGCNMFFPEFNTDGQPMYKTALGGTTKSAWVKIAFQQYCGPFEDPVNTEQTILTMGNISQPGSADICKAVIKAFQYGWGAVNQGNRCKITILDQKGSSFQEWVERIGINPEGDSKPVQGKYRMKVQFGWYVTGGADSDVCGQPATTLLDVEDGILPITKPAEGFNSASIICSPVMYFLTDTINVHYEQGKFVYELEGVDTLVRGQENMIMQIFGRQGKQMYFTKAVELLGQFSFPQFRVEFKALNANGDVVDLQFVKRDGQPNDREFSDDGFADCLGYGPFGVWRPDTKPPLAVIHEWMKKGVMAFDQTGKATSNKGRIGITMNYDPTYKFIPSGKEGATTDDACALCSGNQPQYGRLILFANVTPYCQGNFSDTQINRRMKAVYVANGGNCSPVLHFAPTFRWTSQAAQKAGGIGTPATGTQTNQSKGVVKVNCVIATSTGPNRMALAVPTDQVMKVVDAKEQTQESTFHHIMANLGIGAIEADLRVEGDPSDWLCTPATGAGKFVGIVFINPYFLEPGKTDADCPVWLANDPNSPDAEFRSICNELLTSKGWLIKGADHQIKDGQFVTNLKLQLIAPAAELNARSNPPTSLGAWDQATPMPYGGQGGCLNKFLVGSSGTGWGPQGSCPAQNLWIGGGTACEEGYVETTDTPPT